MGNFKAPLKALFLPAYLGSNSIDVCQTKLENSLEVPFGFFDTSTLNIFQILLSVGNLIHKLKWGFKLILKPKFWLLNFHPAYLPTPAKSTAKPREPRIYCREPSWRSEAQHAENRHEKEICTLFIAQCGCQRKFVLHIAPCDCNETQLLF